MRGVMIQNDKPIMTSITPFPGTTINTYEGPTYFWHNTGANQTETQTTATLDLQNVTLDRLPTSARPFQANGTGSLNVSGGPNITNAAGTSGLGVAFFQSAGAVATAGDSFSLDADDLDNDGTDDFFMVQLGAGTVNANTARSSTGVFYGGTFTPAAAVQATGTATYARTNGATVNTVRGTSNTPPNDQDFDARITADVSLTANFDTGKVNGTLTGVGNNSGVAGVGTTTNIVLENATINGNAFDGGTARMVNGSTNVYSGGSSSFNGNFMGSNGEAAAGTALITGTIGGVQSATTAVFVGDKQP